jgi:hypothetical protein
MERFWRSLNCCSPEEGRLPDIVNAGLPTVPSGCQSINALSLIEQAHCPIAARVQIPLAEQQQLNMFGISWVTR